MTNITITTYPLRLPKYLKAAVARLAKQQGVSLNQFFTLAVAEKVSAIDAVTFFEERRQRADFAAFDRIMSRSGGEPPREGDELPE